MRVSTLPPLTAADLRDVISYDPETGVLRWLSDGSEVAPTAGAYPRFRVNGRWIRPHVAAWVLSGRHLPAMTRVMHINGDPGDNRLSNLRLGRESEITVELLRMLFSYDPVSGELRHKAARNGSPIGVIATSPQNHGYLTVCVNGISRFAHRIVWAIVHGELLERFEQIDHINGNRRDNRIDNLRCVTPSGNSQNVHVRNGVPIQGCHYNKSRQRWQSAISTNGKRVSLGRFDSEEEARAAYLRAKAVRHIPTIVAGTATPLPPLEAQ